MVYCINSKLFTVTGRSVPPRLLTLLCPSVQYFDSQRIKQEGNQEGNKRHIFENPKKRIQISNSYKNVQSLFRQRQQKAFFFSMPTYPVQAYVQNKFLIFAYIIPKRFSFYCLMYATCHQCHSFSCIIDKQTVQK